MDVWHEVFLLGPRESNKPRRLPSKWLCEALNLRYRANTWDLHDASGVASLYREIREYGSHINGSFSYLRRDLLDSYLAQFGKRWCGSCGESVASITGQRRRTTWTITMRTTSVFTSVLTSVSLLRALNRRPHQVRDAAILGQKRRYAECRTGGGFSIL
jgi:hypothetical protein